MALPMGRCFAILFVYFVISGCSSLYLHSDEKAQLAKEVVEAFEDADTDKLFDRARTDLEDYLQRRQAAFTDMAGAAQDLQLVSLIDGADPGALQGVGKNQTLSSTAAMSLQSLVEFRLDALIGQTARTTYLARTNVAVYRNLREVATGRLRTSRKRFADTWRLYERAGGTASTKCDKFNTAPFPQLPPVGDPQAAQALYQALIPLCDDIARDIKTAETELTFTDTKGELTDSQKRLKNYLSAKLSLTKAHEALKVKFIKLQDSYKEALEANDGCGLANDQCEDASKALAKAAKDIEDFLKDLDNASNVLEQLNNIQGTPDLAALQGIIDQPAAWVGEVLSAELLETDLRSLLQEAVDPKEEPETDAEKRPKSLWLLSARTINLLAPLTERTQDAPTTIPSTNALLISLAFQQYRQEITNVEIIALDAKIGASRSEVKALQEEILLLWEAHRQAKTMESMACGGSNAHSFAIFMQRCKGDLDAKTIAAQALVAYDASWSRGLTPAVNAAIAGSGYDQQLALEEAKRNAKGWFDLIKPALDELRAYGEGGIKAETIANLFNALGLTAIAIGTN
jgi:hypothetical protein